MSTSQEFSQGFYMKDDGFFDRRIYNSSNQLVEQYPREWYCNVTGEELGKTEQEVKRRVDELNKNIGKKK